MSHETWTEACVAFVLGTLTDEERARLEAHLRGGCADCEGELRQLALVSSTLAAGAPRQSPPPRLRVRLLSEAGLDRTFVVRAGDGVWEAVDPGAEPAAIRSPAGCTLFASSVGAFAPAGKARTVRTAEARWRDLGGLSFGTLLDADAARGTQTVLIRMDLGGVLDEHEHGGPEESFLLAGECTTQDKAIAVGDYLRAPGGSHHGETRTAHGCRMIVVQHAA